jgi:hypothetical protein
MFSDSQLVPANTPPPLHTRSGDEIPELAQLSLWCLLLVSANCFLSTENNVHLL